MNEKSVIILFGAGVYAKKYKALLEYLHMDFDYFTDNDPSKWGTILYGKPVISPNELTGFLSCKIIISSTHEIAIRKQLIEMGLHDFIVGLDDLYDLCEKQMRNTNEGSFLKQNNKTIIVDMYEGIGWGGTELWAANLAYQFRKKGNKAFLIGGTEQPELEDNYESITWRISEQETIMKMVEVFKRNLPCVFINNFAGCAFLAAIIVKRNYPDYVKIISVIHNDNKSLFNAHMMLKKYIDKVFCVSRQIADHMEGIYDFDTNKYYFKEQPIRIDENWKKEQNLAYPIRIGYAARLVHQQKRADLLPDLIKKLEESGIDYLFQIAGEGECLEKIESFIIKNNLSYKVQLLGRLSKSEMDAFWKKQDIFVNISEYEGTSLSMLEAMSYGCVPVVTDVSGAREFITDEENGYICPVGTINQLVDCIKKLDKDREKLYQFGEKCFKIIQERCNPEQYFEYWSKNVI